MKPNDEDIPSFESIDARFYTFPWPDVLALNIIDNPEDRLPFLATIFGLTRPMLVAMTNNPMIPETWQAAIDLLLATLDAMTREGQGEEPRLPVC